MKPISHSTNKSQWQLRRMRWLFSWCVAILLLAISATAQTGAVDSEGHQWWQHAVFYELYPRSFADSNNDGLGDLPGITSKLDYLHWLGVDALWIAPCFKSPQVDFGYDVSDYRDINPEYGTLADMDRLIAEGKKRNVRVVLDLVVNHTSDQHPWFIESRSSKTSPKRDWYIWRDGRGPGVPPNNWVSIFGGPAWRYDATSGQWYYHFFYPQQPDLNWRNPQVKDAMFDVARWWFQRGVAGFRLDAVTTLFEDPQLRDNPVQPGKNAYGDPVQEKLYNENLPEMHVPLKELRRVADPYGAVLIGETWTSNISGLKQFYGANGDELQLAMDFLFTTVDSLSAAKFRQQIALVETSGIWPVYLLSNHDIRRHYTRYGDGVHNDRIAKLLATLYLTLRGTPIMYYGEEIGMRNRDPRTRAEVKDPIGKLGWPEEKGRDGERTPMQWTPAANAGFSTSTPWLPVGLRYRRYNVEREKKAPYSILNYYRRLLALRHNDRALLDGKYVPLNEADRNVLAYLRSDQGENVLVILNMSPVARRFRPRLGTGRLPGRRVRTLLASFAAPRQTSLRQLALPPYSAWIAEVM